MHNQWLKKGWGGGGGNRPNLHFFCPFGPHLVKIGPHHLQKWTPPPLKVGPTCSENETEFFGYKIIFEGKNVKKYEISDEWLKKGHQKFLEEKIQKFVSLTSYFKLL